jgi:ATP-binding cassette subfamily F protein 3
MLVAEIRSYLARYLFTGEDVFKKVVVLSGGERGRLALAKLALSNANLLLLDEPTNHLDIPAQEVLQNVLADYTGTIILVSHDRYLIDALSTQIWDIDAQTGRLRVYKGTYSEYKTYREKQIELASRDATDVQMVSVDRQERTARNRALAEARRRETRLGEVESQIARLESQLAVLAQKLEVPPPDSDQVRRLGDEYVRLQDKLNSLLSEWETLHQA